MFFEPLIKRPLDLKEIQTSPPFLERHHFAQGGAGGEGQCEDAGGKVVFNLVTLVTLLASCMFIWFLIKIYLECVFMVSIWRSA